MEVPAIPCEQTPRLTTSPRNPIITLPDGAEMVRSDGAVLGLRLVVGDVEIPSFNLAALPVGEEPQPATGPARSSGGNLLAAESDVGDPYDLAIVPQIEHPVRGAN